MVICNIIRYIILYNIGEADTINIRGEAEIMKLNRFIVGDAVEVLKHDFPENYVDLTVTSPPYDNLRNYNNFSFDANSILSAIFRVAKPGGVCVWVVGEKINSGRSLSSFNHAFAGRDCGLLCMTS